MMATSTRRTLVMVLAGLLAIGTVASSAPNSKLSGSVVGFVSNQIGVPQMGAAVLLFNGYDRLVGRALTNERGAFGFESLLPGSYTVRVALASFVPAIKEDIKVQPGMRSFLSINLASLLSSIELVASAPGDSKMMHDDWMWVLRTATPARPVLRIIPGIDISDPAEESRGPTTSIFSRTHGLVKVTTGEEGSFAGMGAQADLGTSFALATSLFGTNELQFSGNFGYASNTGTPTAGFRTSYTNELWGVRPEVAVTMRQVDLRGRAGSAFISGNQENAPRLQTMSVSTLERRKIGERLHLEYGASLESVAFLKRLNYLSPFARLTTDLGKFGAVELAYASGIPPIDLLATANSEMELQSDLTALAMFPRVSLVGGEARVQRTQNFEVAYRKVLGSRSISLGAYREGATNAAVIMAAPAGHYSSGDLLPDLSSNASVFNIGDYERLGFMVSASQKLGGLMALSVGVGNQGVLLNQTPALVSNDPQELRSGMRDSRRYWVATQVTGVVPGIGTQFSASYQWTDYSALSPTHLYLTTGMQPQVGLNIRLRQSLPSFGVWNGRLVASAELRNLLAQGYIPITTADGRKLYLIQNPRGVRGGLSFIF